MAKSLSDGKEVLVFDFCHSSVLVLQAEVTNQRARIKNQQLVPLEIGGAAEEPKALLKKALSSFDLRRPELVVTWEEGMVLRQMMMPSMPDDDLKKAILWELGEKFSVRVEDTLVDWDCVFEGDVDGNRQKLLTVFYCDKKTAIERIRLIQGLGLEVSALIPGQAALAHFVQGLSLPEEAGVLVCDIGYLAARILIVRKTKNMLSRAVPLGGQQLTEMLTASFVTNGQTVGLNVQEAERLKIQEGARDPQAPHMVLLRPYLDKVAAEIKRSIDYYEAQKYSAAISKIIFTGGGANLKGLRESMAAFLNMEILTPNPEEYFGTEISAEKKEFVCEHFALFAQALGAAASKDRAMNLMPLELIYQRLRDRKRLSVRMAFFANAIFLAFLTIWVLFQTSIAGTQLKATAAEWGGIRSVDQLIGRLAAEGLLMKSALKGDLLHPALLKQLSLVTPDTVLIDELLFNRQTNTVTIRGMVRKAAGKGDVKLIAQFTNDLVQSPFFVEAAFKTTVVGTGAPSARFEITCVTRGTS